MPITLGYLKLGNAAGHTLTGSALSMNGGNGAAAIFVPAGLQDITAATNFQTDTRVSIAPASGLILDGAVSITAGKRVTVAGGGTLSIFGASSNGAGASLAVDAGFANLQGNIGAGIATPADRPDLFASTPGGGPGATVVLNASQNLDSLAANPAGIVRLAIGGNKFINTNTVGASGTGEIDLGDGDLVAKASPVGTWNGTAYTDVAGLVDSGRGPSSNAQWDGGGIVTTDTRAVNNNDLTSLGVASGANLFGTATAVWNGQTVSPTDTLVMFTWGGDANLDGKINIDDYGQIDFNVGSSGSVFGWYNGDFNYDGKINIDDYGIIDFNVTAQTGSLASASGIEGVAAVPEPASVALLAAGALGLFGRRRRQN
ncbi:MAG: PEP-CTERM sorting domain-containing protein [Tepidisphaeraceae bacterium]